MVVCLVAELAPGRISRLVFVDALALSSGETIRDIVKRSTAQATGITAGPTKEERAIADAQVKAAAAALAVLERRLDKTILRAPSDGIVSVIVAEVFAK